MEPASRDNLVATCMTTDCTNWVAAQLQDQVIHSHMPQTSGMRAANTSHETWITSFKCARNKNSATQQQSQQHESIASRHPQKQHSSQSLHSVPAFKGSKRLPEQKLHRPRGMARVKSATYVPHSAAPVGVTAGLLEPHTHGCAQSIHGQEADW